MKHRLVIALLAMITSTLLPTLPASANQVVFNDDFSTFTATNCPSYTDGSSFGQWQVVFAGYGCVRIVNNSGNNALEMQPRAVATPGDTSAPLVIGPSFEAPFTYKGQVATTAQLRQNSAPNPWETAWIIWNYTDNQHFYYFIPKENGWELGKEDPAYPGSQRFLATGSTPTFAPTDLKNFEITQINNTMTISINGNKIVEFTDTERPYTSGHIGLYSEDARFIADNITVTKPSSTPTTPINPPSTPVTPSTNTPAATPANTTTTTIANNRQTSQPKQTQLAETGNAQPPTVIAAIVLLLGATALQLHKLHS